MKELKGLGVLAVAIILNFLITASLLLGTSLLPESNAAKKAEEAVEPQVLDQFPGVLLQTVLKVQNIKTIVQISGGTLHNVTNAFRPDLRREGGQIR